MVPILPEETLVSIFSYLSPGEQLDHQSLFNLSLASQAFKRITEPLLYHTFQRKGENRVRQTRLFLRTIIPNPKLARLVNHIHLSESWYFRRGIGRSLAPPESLDPPPADLAALYEEDLLRSCITRDVTFRHFCTDLRNGYEDPEIALLFSLCPNVTHLDFIAPTSDRSYVWQAFRDHWTPSLKAPEIPIERRMFSKLISAYARPESTRYTWLSEYVRFFFPLPHFQTLVGTFCHVAEFGYGGLPLSNLTQIKFTDSGWDMEGIAELLQACPKLEVLELHAGGHGGCSTDYIGLGEVLRRHGTSIRFLLIHPPKASLEDYNEGQANTIGNLKPLKQLLRLEIPLELLSEEKEMPLNFTTSNAENERYLDELVSKLRINLPASLRSLNIPGYCNVKFHEEEGKPLI